MLSEDKHEDETDSDDDAISSSTTVVSGRYLWKMTVTDGTRGGDLNERRAAGVDMSLEAAANGPPAIVVTVTGDN